MENIGWDYSKLNREGKNVYLFRDTNHASSIIQRRLIQEIDTSIQRGYFDAMFIEGVSGGGPIGSYFPSSLSEETVEEAIVRMKGFVSHYEILSHRINRRGVNFLFYGAEEEELLSEHGRVLGKLETCSNLDFSERQQLSCLAVQLSHARSRKAASLVSDYLESSGSDSVGLSFGDGHTEVITSMFDELGMGYLSYFPGEMSVSKEDQERYSNYIFDKIKV